MNNIQEKMNMMDNMIKYLSLKMDKAEFDRECNFYFNEMIDTFIELTNKLKEENEFFEYISNSFSDSLVNYINYINNNELSNAIFLFLNEILPGFYDLKSVLSLKNLFFYIIVKENVKILTVTDEILTNEILIEFKHINDYSFDHVHIISKDYNLIKNGLSKILIKNNLILPSSYSQKNHIETFQLDTYLKLKNKDFSLVSDDCWGGFLYKQLGLKYNTPFMWLFIFNNDYLKLVKELKLYLNSKLEFVNIPYYNHPVGLLGDVKIYFNHYRSNEEAEAKWIKRLNSFNWDNIYYKMSAIQEEDALEFHNILKTTPNRISFSPIDYDLNYNIFLADWIKEDVRKRYSGFYQYLHLNSNKYFDAINWLNGNNNFNLSVPHKQKIYSEG